MLNSISSAVNAVSGVLYEPYVLPLILILAGIFFTFISSVKPVTSRISPLSMVTVIWQPMGQPIQVRFLLSMINLP